MTAKEAKTIVENKYPNQTVVECLDFSDFFAFALAEKGKENEDFGGGYITLNKETKKLGSFNPTEDLDSFVKAKSIEV